MKDDYIRDYEKLYSRVFPVYNKPKEEGRYTKEMTLRPMRRYYKARKLKPTAVYAFIRREDTLCKIQPGGLPWN